MVPRPSRVLARAPGDAAHANAAQLKRSPSAGRSPPGGSVPGYAGANACGVRRTAVTSASGGPSRLAGRPALRFDLLPPCTPITARQRTRRGCATSRPAWASPSAAPTASSPAWPRPATSSGRKTAAATATRSRHTCRCQHPPGQTAPSAKSWPSWPEPAPGRGRAGRTHHEPPPTRQDATAGRPPGRAPAGSAGTLNGCWPPGSAEPGRPRRRG
jgi:hypothetical protein